MKVSSLELRARCDIGLKMLREKGIKITPSMPLGKMGRKHLVGLWGSLSQELTEVF